MKFKTRLELLILIVFLFSVLCVSAQQSVTSNKRLNFDQALELTRNNSHIIKQDNFSQKEKEQEVKAAKNLYLPKIGITASYMAMSDNLHLDLNPIKNSITPLYQALGNFGNFSGVPNPDPSTNQVLPILPDNLSTKAVRSQLLGGLEKIEASNWDEMIQKKNFGSVLADFEWPIYAGGKIKLANKVAEIHKNEADEVTRQKEGELMSELAERYFGLCLAQQAVLVRTDVFNGVENHLNDAIKMEAAGLIARAEMLHAKVSEAQAQRELSKAKRMADVLNTSLLNTLALEEEVTLQPESDLFYLDSIESVNHFKSIARQNNPLLMQVNSKKQLADQGYKAEKAEYFPVIAFQGMYDLANKDLSQYLPDWTVGIGLRWTLFDGSTRYRKTKAAALKKEEVNEIGNKAESDVETMIEKLYHELNMYKEQLVELESANVFADEYLRVREKAFHEEMSNSTEVVDARLALAQVKIERLQAMYGYDVTLARILQYAGIPDEFPAYQKRLGVKTEKYKPSN
jgi:outer membrane protein TolC